LEFREYLAGMTLRQIDDAFGLGGFEVLGEYIATRRGRVVQYYEVIDFASRAHVRRLFSVYEHALDQLEQAIKHGDEFASKSALQIRDSLIRCLQHDGIDCVDGRLISHSAELQNIRDAISTVDAPELARQLSRLREAVDEDPALAIGTAKEMLETTCKTILDREWVDYDETWDLPKLLKVTLKELKLLPENIPNATRGAETIKRLLSSLGQIGYGLAELRNFYGSGHGRSGRAKGLPPRHARLAIGAVVTLMQFLFDTYNERSRQK